MATLFVVATPMGNLEDLTPRAARTLAQAPVIAAESVTRTRKLLTHLGLAGKKVISCRESNRRQAAALVKGALDAGQDVALVSDAGTPGLSDPGWAVVETLRESGHGVSPVPGPSALAAALSVAGMPAAPVVFLGFPPVKPGPRRRLIAQAAAPGWALCLYEAPHRLEATAADLLAVLGDRPAVLCRELTKVHEEVDYTSLARLAQEAGQREWRGEITLVVAGGELPAAEAARDQEVDDLLREGLARGDAGPSKLAKRVAAATGLGREEVYRRLMALKDEIGALEGRRSEGAPMGPTGEIVTSQMGEAESQDSLECRVSVVNGLGLHARVAARIAAVVQEHDCSVSLVKDQVEAEGDSILSILTLDAPQGSQLLVRASGPQAKEVLEALSGLFADGFGEDK